MARRRALGPRPRNLRIFRDELGGLVGPVVQHLEAVRKTYDSPLTLAHDMMVWNVTDEQIVVRETFEDENVASTGTMAAYRKAKRESPEVAKDWISPDINPGKWNGYTAPPLPKK